MSEQNRYLRNLILEKNNQEKIFQAKVFMLGLGGLGGNVLDMLLRLGVGEIICADGDKFETTNLNRQLLCNENNLGQYKALIAKEYAQKINSNTKIIAHAEFLDYEKMTKLIADCDIAIDCLGGLEDKILLEKACSTKNIPLISAGIAGYTGWVSTIMPNSKISPLTLMRAGKNAVQAEDILGNLVTTVSITAALEVQEFIKYICSSKDTLKNKMLIFDLFTCNFEVVSL